MIYYKQFKFIKFNDTIINFAKNEDCDVYENIDDFRTQYESYQAKYEDQLTYLNEFKRILCKYKELSNDLPLDYFIGEIMLYYKEFLKVCDYLPNEQQEEKQITENFSHNNVATYNIITPTEPVISHLFILTDDTRLLTSELLENTNIDEIMSIDSRQFLLFEKYIILNYRKYITYQSTFNIEGEEFKSMFDSTTIFVKKNDVNLSDGNAKILSKIEEKLIFNYINHIIDNYDDLLREHHFLYESARRANR